MAGKYHSLSPYNYCAGNPGNVVDPDGSIIGTVFDAVSLVTGVKSFVSNVKQGNVKDAIIDGVGIVLDAASLATPLVSSGAGMAIKAARGADKVTDAAKGLKNADRIKEGLAFEKSELAAAKASGKNVEGQIRLVPKNGKGNISGNRSTVDQLIDNGDGTFTVVETKLTNKSRPSTGQKAVMKHVKEGGGKMELRSDFGEVKKAGDEIFVSDYQIKYKYE